MIHKLAALFVVITLIVVSHATTQQREASKEVRSKLLMQVLADDSDVRDEKGSPHTMTVNIK